MKYYFNHNQTQTPEVEIEERRWKLRLMNKLHEYWLYRKFDLFHPKSRETWRGFIRLIVLTEDFVTPYKVLGGCVVS